MTKKEKDAIIAKGEEEARAKEEAEQADKGKKKSKKVESEDEEEDDDAEPVEEEESEDESDEDDADEDEEDIDYEAIAQAEAERADKAEKALAQKAFDDREARRKGKKSDKKDEEDEGDDDDEDKPLTRKELNSIREQDRQTFQKEAQNERALDIARQNTSSEAEAKAAHLIWRNRVVPTGNLEEDVLFAIGGLNRKKFIARTTELKRALKSKDTTSRNATGTQKNGADGREAKLSPQDAQSIKSSGMVWDGVKRVYKKPLGNGKQFFYYDPRTKRRWKA